MTEPLEGYTHQFEHFKKIVRIMEYVIKKTRQEPDRHLITTYPIETLLSLPEKELDDLFQQANTFLYNSEPRHIGEAEEWIQALREKRDKNE